MTAHLLTLVIALPLIGALVVLLVPNRDEQGANGRLYGGTHRITLLFQIEP